MSRKFYFIFISLIYSGMLLAKAPSSIPESTLKMNYSKYEQYGAVILRLNNNITVYKNGTFKSTEHYLIHILNARGFSMGTFNFTYNKKYDKVSIDLARTIMQSGKIHPVTSDTIKDTELYASYPAFTDIMQKVITFPSITDGVFVEIKYSILSKKKIMGGEFSNTYILGCKYPVIDVNLKIQSERKLNYKVYKRGSKIKVKTYKKNSNYKYHYSFQAKSISAFEEEPFMPIGEDILPKVEISSTKNWKAVKDWYSKNTEKTIDNDKNIVSITSSLVAGKTNKDQIIRDIYHWIIENIRYVGVHLGDSDFIPHRASQTLKNKYGDCKDKSTLLISMLRLAGFKAYHVLLSTQATSQADEGLPSLSAFDHMITLVLLNGKKIWLDPTPSFENYGYLHYGDQDRSALIISPEFPSSLIRTPSLDYKASGSFIHYSIFGQNGILISPI